MKRLAIPVLTALLTLAVMFEQGRSVNPVLCVAPAVALPNLVGYEQTDEPPSEAELHTLPADTQIFHRTYTDSEGRWFAVSLIIGGSSKSSIHRPELCLPSQGFQMMAPRERSVGSVDWHLVTLARREASSLGFAYTFFNQAGFRTSSHVRRIIQDVLDRSLRGRIDRWVMLTVNSATDDERIVLPFLKKLEGVVVK